MAQRGEHFFPPGLVATQFRTLERPLHEPGVLRVDALQPPQKIAERIAQWSVGAL